MLARRLTTILPAMSLAEALETTRIHSVAGLTGARTAVVTTRPFRAPHHTISDVGLIGGGQVPLPGEVSLAHHGILFLDELPEFRCCFATFAGAPTVVPRIAWAKLDALSEGARIASKKLWGRST
jgi:predicted ATPase with chaperone activity